HRRRGNGFRHEGNGSARMGGPGEQRHRELSRARHTHPEGVTVKTKGAVLWEMNEKWSVEEIELDPPQEGELLVEFEATGLCHSDHHIRTGDMFGVSFPLIGGHE